jgi:hypothetical protein
MFSYAFREGIKVSALRILICRCLVSELLAGEVEGLLCHAPTLVGILM